MIVKNTISKNVGEILADYNDKEEAYTFGGPPGHNYVCVRRTNGKIVDWSVKNVEKFKD